MKGLAKIWGQLKISIWATYQAYWGYKTVRIVYYSNLLWLFQSRIEQLVSNDGPSSETRVLCKTGPSSYVIIAKSSYNQPEGSSPKSHVSSRN